VKPPDRGDALLQFFTAHERDFRGGGVPAAR